MKASEFDVGTHVRLNWYGTNRFEVTHKGQGHGNVHRVIQVDPETGKPDESKVAPMAVSSRAIVETWDQFLMAHPGWIQEQKRQKEERDARTSLMETVKGAAEETATLLSALGFEAAVREARYSSASQYEIVISNPTENQAFLRRLVAEKWGLSTDTVD